MAANALASAAPVAAPPVRPTGARYGVLGCLCSLSFVLYIDRICISKAAGALASPLFFGTFADWRQAHGYTGREQWDPGFYVYAGVLLLGAVAWLFIDATRSAVEPPAEGAGLVSGGAAPAGPQAALSLEPARDAILSPEGAG